MKKLLLSILATLVALPLVSYAVYDITQFQPRRTEIGAIVQRAAAQDRNPPERVVRMLKASHQNNGPSPKGPSVYASMLLVNELNAVSAHGSTLGWHVNTALWWSLVKLHLTEEEQITIFMSLAPTGGEERRGLTATALALYQRLPADLSLAEIATIMALIRQPTAEGESLDRLREMLLARYARGNND